MDAEDREILENIIEERNRQFRAVIDAQILIGIREPFKSWDFYSGKELDEKAAAIFINFLREGSQVSDSHLREGMARSLGVEAGYKFFDELVQLYENEPDEYKSLSLGVKGGLATALAELLVKHSERTQKVVELASDDANGLSRIILLRGLKKSKSLEAHALIKCLALGSPDLILRGWLSGADWKSYWKKHDPSLFEKWYLNNRKLEKE